MRDAPEVLEENAMHFRTMLSGLALCAFATGACLQLSRDESPPGGAPVGPGTTVPGAPAPGGGSGPTINNNDDVDVPPPGTGGGGGGFGGGAGGGFGGGAGGGGDLMLERV